MHIRKILWADALVGGSAAYIGLRWSELLAIWLGLPVMLVRGISLVTLVYAAGATYLGTRKVIPVERVRLLVRANWVWSIVSIGLLGAYYQQATPLGVLYLVLQLAVVAGLAHVEGKALGNMLETRSRDS